MTWVVKWLADVPVEPLVPAIQMTEGARVSVGRTGPTERREKKSNRGWETTLVIGLDPCERGSVGMGGVHGDLDRSHRDGDAGADPEELEPERSGGGAGQAGAHERAPEDIEEDRREGGEEEAELVGGEARRRVRSEKRSSCCSLIVFFHVAPRTVDALVDGAGREGAGGQRGDDEAGVGLAGQVLRLRDDPAEA